MKTVQKFFVFSTLMVAALIFAGCGEAEKKPADSGTSSTETSDDGSGDKGNASTATSGDFQLVSLNVPNMT